MWRITSLRQLPSIAASHHAVAGHCQSKFGYFANHFNNDRHLNRRDIFKQNLSAALAEWRQLAA
jgi:hypothetical protein